MYSLLNHKLISGIILSLLFLGSFTPHSYGITQAEERAQIEAQLRQIEAEIKEKEKELSSQRKQSGTIKKDLSVLQGEIAAKKLEIQKRTTLLQRLSGQITEKVETIENLSEELSREKQSLARLLRKQNQLEQYSLAEVVLTGQTFSEFFRDISAFHDLKSGLTQSFQKIVAVQAQTAEEKAQLEEKKQEEALVKKDLEKNKAQVEVKHKETDKLLKISVGKEAEYKKTIEERKKKVAELRARLFSLIEVKGGGIQFGQAVKYAKQAGKMAGVRPAFILAILKQETGLGQNVGRCYMTNPSNGSGTTLAGKPISGVMKASRDVQPFLKLMEKLGKDYQTTAVSCPLGGVGYGGAMGPSQFIPSTWNIFHDRISKMTGVTANPWIPLHAFTATALYVADLGATAQTYDAERNAACKYYSGRGCNSPGVRNAFYGNSVMSIASGYADDIEFLDSDE
jgi:hypothetical protein